MKLYLRLLRALSFVKKRLKIIVIGANDGKVNDPSYDFIMGNSGKTDVLLVEPNTAIIPFLEANYSSHPSYSIANYAIGPEGSFQLFTIKEEYWKSFQPTYANGWPEYRAATGLTSGTRQRLEDALIAEGLDPQKAIGVLPVRIMALEDVCNELSFEPPIDILQIDAEGHDDAVIYASNIKSIKPWLIFYESRHLAQSKKQDLTAYLTEAGYGVYTSGGDSLAICNWRNPICIYLRLIVSSIKLSQRVQNKLERQSNRGDA